MDMSWADSEASSSKLNEPLSVTIASTSLIADETSNESTKMSAPVVDSEVISDSPSTKSGKEVRLIRNSSSRVITADTTHIHIEPSNVIEYEWPPKSGERYFIQEQIADLLDVKSFKRKYPELSRHTVEINEREYLIANYKLSNAINEHQMHGLTALRAIEVHELMASDYPEYQRAAADKVKLQMAEDQKRLDAVCFEIIQSPMNRWKRMAPEHTRPGPYPAALIHGQYQHFYKRFTPSELRRLPLSTVVDYDYLLPPRRLSSPLPVVVNEEDMAVASNIENDESSNFEMQPSFLSSSNYSSGVRAVKLEKDPQDQVKKQQCSICDEADKRQMLSCSNCHNTVHPDCASLPTHVVKVALNYKWNCIECKKCTVCEKPDNEDAMMFCDRCDRGYHTFCVGLATPPNGNWICSSCCDDDGFLAMETTHSS
ncbi:unnamed protein product [Thelazia callipaeda]|uniref:PHD finger protein 10 n=1 Tax=Thelazia callipaeda TaxID=103827 RepID=A0A0N5D4N9_THECL|nr:unnamed protein product [Thelazia callipaeda]